MIKNTLMNKKFYIKLQIKNIIRLNVWEVFIKQLFFDIKV